MVRGGSARSRETVRSEPRSLGECWRSTSRRREIEWRRVNARRAPAGLGAATRMLTGSFAGSRCRRLRGASRDFLGFPGASRLAALGQRYDAEKALWRARFGRSRGRARASVCLQIPTGGVLIDVGASGCGWMRAPGLVRALMGARATERQDCSSAATPVGRSRVRQSSLVG
jgi:hypothetical protein